jgi:hypothetical protein
VVDFTKSCKSKISCKCEFQPIKSLEITLTINLRHTTFCEIDPWCHSPTWTDVLQWKLFPMMETCPGHSMNTSFCHIKISSFNLSEISQICSYFALHFVHVYVCCITCIPFTFVLNLEGADSMFYNYGMCMYCHPRQHFWKRFICNFMYVACFPFQNFVVLDTVWILHFVILKSVVLTFQKYPRFVLTSP